MMEGNLKGYPHDSIVPRDNVPDKAVPINNNIKLML